MSLVNAHLDQLEAIEAVHADLGSVRKKAPGDAAAEDAEIQHGLVHSLKRHLDTVTQACLDGDKVCASLQVVSRPHTVCFGTMCVRVKAWLQWLQPSLVY